MNVRQFNLWGFCNQYRTIQMVAKSGVLDGKKDGSPKQKIGIEKVKVR